MEKVNLKVLLLVLYRGTIVNRTYGAHKILYIYLFLLKYVVLFTLGPRDSGGMMVVYSWCPC